MVNEQTARCVCTVPEGGSGVRGITVLLVSVGLVCAQTVTVDLATTFQTIEGFGAFANFGQWSVKQGPFYTPVDVEGSGFYDSLVSEMGLTMLRTMAGHEYNPAPDVWDPSSMQGDYKKFFMMTKFREAAERHDEPLRFVTHVWSPPGWMKVSGEAAGGAEAAPDCETTDCRLIDGMEDEFAHFLAEYVKVIADSTGVDYYAVSIQCEPAFQEPYASCVYCPDHYVETFKTVVDTFRSRGMTNHFFAADDMMWKYPDVFIGALRSDPEALADVHAWGSHGFKVGARADTGSWNGPTDTQKPLWKTSGCPSGDGMNNWDGMMAHALDLLSFLRDGKGSAWLNFSAHVVCVPGSEDSSAGHCALMVNGTPTARYYGISHFSRYIRPGARQVACESSDPAVIAAAFTHQGTGCFTTVLVNRDSTTKALDGISGDGVPDTLEMVVSTETEKLLRDTVLSGDAIELPPSSIVTLVAGRYRSTGALAAAPHDADRHGRGALTDGAGAAVVADMYGLDGRLVRRVALGGADALLESRLAARVYTVVLRDSHGTAVRRHTRLLPTR